MQFLVQGHDGKDDMAYQRRQNAREGHLESIKKLKENKQILFAVAMLNSEGKEGLGESRDCGVSGASCFSKVKGLGSKNARSLDYFRKCFNQNISVFFSSNADSKSVFYFRTISRSN